MDNNAFKKPLMAAAIAGGTLLLALALLSGRAHAADLGGGCCADLEERIAELEATAAKKGNRKISLTVSGQISKALVSFDVGDYNQLSVLENSAAESFVGFRGEANIGDGWKAGFNLEIGVGGYDEGSYYGYGAINDGETDGIYTRQSNVWVGGPVGRLTIGKASQATDGIAEISVANTAVASRMLSLRPLIGPEVLEVADIFDGTRENVVRYDSPLFSGFSVSASYAFGIDDAKPLGDVWDISLRYAGEFSGFQVAAGVGYKSGLVVPTYFKIEDTDTLSGSASVKHVLTGVFLNGAYGDLDLKDLGADGSIKGWMGQGGWENRLFALGKTTVFAEYGRIDIGNAIGADLEPTIIGAGLVQSIDAAALDLYVSGRQYDLDTLSDDKVTVLTAGARVKF